MKQTCSKLVRWGGILWVAAMPLWLTPPASAQFGPKEPPVKVWARAIREEAQPGERFVVAVVLDHDKGMHTWPSADQDVLPPKVAKDAIRTSMTVDQPDWAAGVGPIQWPEPRPGPIPDVVNFGPDPIMAPVYQGRAVAYVPIVIAQDAPPGPVSLAVVVNYQACDETQCFMPEQIRAEASFRIVPVGSPPSEPVDPDLFAGFDASVFALGGDDGATPPAGDSTDSASEGADAEFPTELDLGAFGLKVGLPRGPAGLALVLLIGATGGLLLNLTPCVLPVIPIKIMGLSQAAGDRRKTLFLGAVMSLGVVAFWLAIGIPVAFVKTFQAPSQLFSFWWFTFLMGLFIAAMGLGLMGLFTISLPKVIYKVNPKIHTVHGSFLFGMMTAVLGMPCFAPVMGGVTAFATRLSPGFVVAVFASIGVGMALPYLILSANPKWVDRVPRTGPASELVKQVMGLILLAASAFFVGAGTIALVQERPYLAKTLHWWAVAGLLSLAGLWLALRTFQITKRPVPRVVFTVFAVAIAGLGIMIAQAFTSIERSAYRPASADAGEASDEPWGRYSDERFEAERRAGRVVVLDFTAEWCLNCKTLWATVLNTDTVQEAISAEDVVSMEVDLTSRKAPGWAKLHDLGESGIPLLAIFGPGVDQPIKSNAYTPGQVATWIERARGPRTAAVGD